MEYFKICFCFSFLIWIVLHCYNTLFSSVCCPVFPCAFYSITFLSSFSISLSILVTSFLVYYFHSSLSGSCSLSISVSEIFSLFFISFGVFFSFPLLFFLPRFFFISVFFLYADTLHLLPRPLFLSLRWPFFLYVFIFLPVDLFPFLLLTRSRPSSIPSFFQSIFFFSPLFLLSPFFISFSFPIVAIFHCFFFSSNGLLSFFFSVSNFFIQYSSFCWISSFHSSFCNRSTFFLFFFFFSGDLLFLLFLSLRRLFSLLLSLSWPSPFLPVGLLPLFFCLSVGLLFPPLLSPCRLSHIPSLININFLSSFFSPVFFSFFSPLPISVIFCSLESL